mmetsp:Transcript_79751/g.141203  ORF Transcript_79751/g.141203 Transcript_79751/m.141203 type:complete len:824 (-) Transcript_79751:97-2568(-)
MSDAKALFDKAKELYVAEDCDAAKEAVTRAKEAYSKAGDMKGVADCFVLIAEITLCEVDYMRFHNAFGAADDIKDALKEADQKIEAEVDYFKKAKNVYGEASMLYAVAKLNAEKRGPKKKQKALDAAVEAEQLFVKDGNEAMQAEALLIQAPCHFRSTRTQEALTCGEEALAIAEKCEAKEVQAKAWSINAVCTGALCDLKGAVEAMTASLTLYRELGIKKQEAIKLYTLAQWHNLRERPREALTAAKEALALFEEIDYGKGWQGGAMKILAMTYLELGDTRKAKELASMYLTQYIKAKDKRMMALCNELLSVIHRTCGELYDAIDCAQEAVKISKNLGDEEYEAICRQELARAQHAAVRTEDFKEMMPILDNMQTSANLWSKLGNNKREAEAWNVLGELYRTTTHTMGAMETSAKALLIYQDKSDLSGQGNSLMIQAQACLDVKKFKEALDKAREAAACFKELKDATMEGAVYGIISECAKGEGDLEAAMEAAKKRHSLLTASAQTKTAASSFQMVAERHIERGEYMKALKLCLEGAEKCRKAEDRFAQLKALITTMHAVAQLLGGSASLPRSSKEFGMTLEKGFRVGKEAKELSEKLDQGRGPVGYWMAHMCLYAGRTNDALEEAELARANFKEDRDSRSEGNSGLLVADIYKAMDKKEDSMAALQETLQIARKLSDKEIEAAALKRVGELGGGMGMFDPATMMQMMQGMPIAPGAISATASAAPAISEEVAVAVTAAASGPPAKASKEVILKRIQNLALDVSGATELVADVSLMDSGLDSLAAVSFRNDLAKEFELTLGASVIFDYPTIRALTDMVMESI